jgi:hypothetical protein
MRPLLSVTPFPEYTHWKVNHRLGATIPQTQYINQPGAKCYSSCIGINNRNGFAAQLWRWSLTRAVGCWFPIFEQSNVARYGFISLNHPVDHYHLFWSMLALPLNLVLLCRLLLRVIFQQTVAILVDELTLRVCCSVVVCNQLGICCFYDFAQLL